MNVRVKETISLLIIIILNNLYKMEFFFYFSQSRTECSSHFRRYKYASYDLLLTLF